MTRPPPSVLTPPRLKPGDRVAVVSPAGPILPEHLEAGLERLKSWGLEPITDESTFARERARGYLAGSDTARAEALQRALDDPDIAAVWCARGGYGVMRLLERLEVTALRQRPKWIIGFSDITALLLWSAHRAGVVSLHAPVIKSLADRPALPQEAARAESARRLHEALFHARPPLHRDLHIELPGVRSGLIRGRVVAGNLSLIQALLNTPYLPTLCGAVLFIEDVAEQDYRLDRLMTSLRLRSLSAPPEAIVLGEFTGCGGVYVAQPEIPDHVLALAREFHLPVVHTVPMSHGAANWPVPLGARVEIDPSARTMRFILP